MLDVGAWSARRGATWTLVILFFIQPLGRRQSIGTDVLVRMSPRASASVSTFAGDRTSRALWCTDYLEEPASWSLRVRCDAALAVEPH